MGGGGVAIGVAIGVGVHSDGVVHIGIIEVYEPVAVVVEAVAVFGGRGKGPWVAVIAVFARGNAVPVMVDRGKGHLFLPAGAEG